MAGWGFYFVATSVANVEDRTPTTPAAPSPKCAHYQISTWHFMPMERLTGRGTVQGRVSGPCISRKCGSEHATPNRARIALRLWRARHAEGGGSPTPTRRHTPRHAAQRLAPAQTLGLSPTSPPADGASTTQRESVLELRTLPCESTRERQRASATRQDINHVPTVCALVRT
jgi:hypothetical protein